MDFVALHASAVAIEDVAEAYIFDRLSPADAAEYEEHLFVCPSCRGAVESADEFIQLFRQAVEASQPSGRPRLL